MNQQIKDYLSSSEESLQLIGINLLFKEGYTKEEMTKEFWTLPVQVHNQTVELLREPFENLFNTSYNHSVIEMLNS